MNPKVKLAAYVVLIILTAWFGFRFYSSYTSAGSKPATTVAVVKKKKKAKETKTPPALAATNASAADTNAVATSVNATNSADEGTNAVAQTPASNSVAQASPTDTNQTATATASNASVATADQDPTTLAQTISGGNQGRSVANLALFVLSAAGLGLLVALDFTSLLGSKAGDYLFSDVGDAQRDPEYEKAEQVWANGNHLEAIQILRDYYKHNPRQVHAALRIAEIYEKDLRNYLAAALEYEEVLKRKLPDDRWGWAAIHLCNLYSRLGQQDKTMALLQRLADEYPKTAAAKKARQRLGLPEPEEVEPVKTAGEAPSVMEEEKTFELSSENTGEWLGEEGAPPPTKAEEEPKSNLPPGFRKKK